MDNGADVNIRNRIGSTALVEAAKYGHQDMVKALLHKGAEVNPRTKRVSMALMWASGKG